MSWDTVPLSDVYWFQEGPGVRKWQFTTEGIKLLNVGNITPDGRIDLDATDRHLSVEEATGKYSHFLVDAGDLVIASSGISFDEDGFLRTKIAFVESEHLPLCMNTSTIRFKAAPDGGDLRYLKHWLQSFEFRKQVSKFVTGSAQLNFGPSHLKKMTIRLPPLPEQKRIAAILDQADALRRQRQRALDYLNQLGQSIFYEMFGDPSMNPNGWNIGTIRDLITEAKYGTSKKANTKGRGMPILRMGNITYDGQLDLSDLKYVEFSEIEFPKYTTEPGDILFNRTNSKELVGKTAVVLQAEPLAIAGYLVRARTNSFANPHYISAYLNSEHGKLTLKNMCNNIVGMANINAQKFQDIPIAKPPIDLQDLFAERLAVIEFRKIEAASALDTTKTLFSALQQRAFRGEL